MEQTSRRILLVGHCGPDNSYLRITIASAVSDAQVVFANSEVQLQAALRAGVNLVLFNRELDGLFDMYTGIEYIRALRQSHPDIKTMLVSNYPEAQTDAVAAGALPGFGKRQLGSPQVVALLREALEDTEAERV
jgi:two-component system, chemotaxis family, chemotaxis protein CheY